MTNSLDLSVFEIFEIILATSILLIISTAIFAMSDPDRIETKILGYQYSALSNIIPPNSILYIKTDVKVTKDEDIIQIQSSKNTQNLIGFNTDVTIENKQDYIIMQK